MLDEFSTFFMNYAQRIFTTVPLQLGTRKITTFDEKYAGRGLCSTGVNCILFYCTTQETLSPKSFPGWFFRQNVARKKPKYVDPVTIKSFCQVFGKMTSEKGTALFNAKAQQVAHSM
jgi:hypothetical protein